MYTKASWACIFRFINRFYTNIFLGINLNQNMMQNLRHFKHLLEFTSWRDGTFKNQNYCTGNGFLQRHKGSPFNCISYISRREIKLTFRTSLCFSSPSKLTRFISPYFSLNSSRTIRLGPSPPKIIKTGFQCYSRLF